MAPVDQAEAPAARRAPANVDDLQRATCTLVGDYLRDALATDVRDARLPELLGFVVAPREPGARLGLVVAADASPAERLYLYVHTAAHVLLGHTAHPFATLLEPRRGADAPPFQVPDWEARQHEAADALARVMFWGCDGDAWEAAWPPAAGHTLPQSGDGARRRARELGGLLLGGRHQGLRRGLRRRMARQAVLLGLRLARAAYHRSGVRRVVADEPFVQGLREVYCVAEAVSAIPQLVAAGTLLVSHGA